MRVGSSATPQNKYRRISITRLGKQNMSTKALRRAAIYIKEAAGYHSEENSKELQTHHCDEFCKAHGLEIITRYHDGVGIRAAFDWMIGEATQDTPPFEFIVVYKLRNFSCSPDETVLCRDRLKANGVSLLSTAEISM